MQGKNKFVIWNQNDKILIKESSDAQPSGNKGKSEGKSNQNILENLCMTIKKMNHCKFWGKDGSLHLNTKNRYNQLYYQNNLLFFLENVFSLLNKVLSEKGNSKIREQLSSSKLTSFAINQDNILELIFENDGNKSKKNECEISIDIFSDIINKYKEIIKKEINDDNLNKENESFLKELENLIKEDLSKNDYSILNVLSSKIYKLSQKNINRMHFSNTEIDKYLRYFLLISKYQKKYQNFTIFNILDLISKLYESNIGTSYIIQSLQEFINLVNNNDDKFDSFDQKIQKELDQIFSEIPKKKKFYYFDYLFQILIKNILKQEFFISEKTTDFQVGEENYFSFDSSFTYKLGFNNYFYLRKNYNNEAIRELENDIFSKGDYKHIVHFLKTEQPKNQFNQKPVSMVDIPYFPNENVHSLIKNLNSGQRIIINNVDKFVMILEMANTLDKLHDNNKFHGNFCDANVYISSNFDAYIGSFCHSKEDSGTVSKDYTYFKSPERFNKKSEATKSSDIFSFGIFMYELVTETIVATLNKKSIKPEELASKINECLFSEKQNKYFNVEYVDFCGNSMHGFKEIIEKCVKAEPKDRHENMKVIIDALKELNIYKNNKEEIEFRIKKCVHGNEYKCSISDLFESYFRGNENSSKFINEFLNKRNKEFNIDLGINFYNDKIRNIFEVFNVTNNQPSIENKFNIDLFNTDERLTILLNKAKYHFFQSNLDFNNNLNSLLQYHHINFNGCYQEFIKRYMKDDKSSLSEKIEEIQVNGNYFYIDFLYQILIDDLFSLDLLAFKFHDMLKNTYENVDRLFDIRITNQFDDCFYQSKLCIDNCMNFYIQKNFGPEYDIESIRREKEILTKEYPFIVHIDENTQDNHNKNIIIPYFPYGNLNNLINNYAISSIDKIVIILEIAMALNSLHGDDKYHGNLSNLSIFISSNLDAYIGNFYYNENNNSRTKPSSHIYYRMPEYFNNTKDNTFIENQARDVYSFGVLMYEILTNISPDKLFKGVSIYNILKENYKDYLFSFQFGKVFLEGEADLDGNSLTGLKDIIAKCIDQKRERRFPTIEKIIEELQKLDIYKNNKTEIDKRIENAGSSRYYNCTLKDLVINYYRGNENSLTDIKYFIEFCTGNSMIHDQKNWGDSFELLYDVLGLELNIKCSVDSNLFELVSKAINHDQINAEEISTLLDEMVKIYGKYIGESFTNSVYQDFINIFNDGNQYTSDSSIREEFIRAFNEAQKQGKYFYIFSFIHLLFQKLFDSRFVDKYKFTVENSNQSMNQFYEIKDELRFNEVNSTYIIQCDKNFIFSLKKAYNANASKNLIQREKSILSKKYSKYIVCLANSESPEQDRKIYIPYYPIGSLESIICKQTINLTGRKNNYYKMNTADKLTIILEIASAILDLHDNNEYHGNLSDQLIFIDSKRNAYIGGFIYDIKLENDTTKPKGPFYYRSPEFIQEYLKRKEEEEKNKKNKNNISDDNLSIYTDNEKNIKEQKSNDIFAFGVLMHEIITEINPETRFGNQSRDVRVKTLSSKYGDFLFSGENNEFFESEDNKGMKEIIEKCLSQDPEERYSNMKEIINSIKELPIYKSNQTEIEYRLEHSTDSREYQCAISDIVESYYQGQGNCYHDLEKIIEKYLNIYLANSQVTFNIEGDIMQNIFTVFNIKVENDFTYLFEDIFNTIIQKYINDFVNHELPIDYRDLLLIESLNFNQIRKEKIIEISPSIADGKKDLNIDLICPILTLSDFIKNNENDIADLMPIWIYNIAIEIQYIHSKNIYHGSLSLNNIGIYYNRETQTFVPSLILFYAFNQLTKQKESDHYRLEKSDGMKKDVKCFIKILTSLNKYIEIPDELIQNDMSINSITYKLYNFFLDKIKEQQRNIMNFDKCFYYNYQITFPILKKIFFSKKAKYSLKNSIIDVQKIVKLIFDFLDFAKTNMDDPIKSIMRKIKSNENQTNNVVVTKDTYDEIIVKTTSFVEDLFCKISEIEKASDSQQDKNETETTTNDLNVDKMSLYNFAQMKSKAFIRKEEFLSNKFVNRTIETTYLTKRAYQSFLRRYIMNLLPNCRYKITHKLNHKTDFNYTDENFKPIELVQTVIQSIPRIDKKAEISEDKNIIIQVNKDPSYK